jgi:HlyD family secretion protein
MYKLIKQLFSLLTTQQRKKFIWMQLLVILAAFGEIIGIASIIPFMTLVGDTNILNEPNYLSNLYANSGFNTELEFVFVVGVFVLIVLVLSSCISIFTIWRLSMFAAQIGTEIGDRLYNFYLKQNWLFHSSINSSELTNKVVNETTRITNGILMPLVTMNARIALAFFMLTGLFIYDPLVATTGVFVFGIAYVFLFIFVRSRLLFNGKNIRNIWRKVLIAK